MVFQQYNTRYKFVVLFFQANIWDDVHMSKIVPALLFNIESNSEAYVFFLICFCLNENVTYSEIKQARAICVAWYFDYNTGHNIFENFREKNG